MSELIGSPLEFRSMDGKNHSLEISPDWIVKFDGQISEHFLGVRAVMAGGFVSLLDTVVSFGDFYNASDAFYRKAVEEELASPLPNFPDKVVGNEYSGHFSRVTVPEISMLRTNLLPLSIGGVKKRVLVCKDTYFDETTGEDYAVDVIRNAHLSDEEGANQLFRRNLETSFIRKRDDLTRVKVRTPRISSGTKASRETIERLERNTIYVPTRASAEQRPKIVIPTAATTEYLDIIVNPKIPSERVISAVGEHVFGLASGVELDEERIMKALRIDGYDTVKTKNALLALKNAGFLIQAGSGFKRTDKVRSND